MKNSQVAMLSFAILFLIMVVMFVVLVRSEPTGEFMNGGQQDTARSYAYEAGRRGIETAVNNYYNIEGDVPVLEATIAVGGQECRIVDVCALVNHEFQLLMDVPSSCAAVGGAGNDNCDSGNCSCGGGHYVWLVDDYVYVHSVCIGEACEASGADGYQGIWP
jgi:hypothetical protein